MLPRCSISRQIIFLVVAICLTMMIVFHTSCNCRRLQIEQKLPQALDYQPVDHVSFNRSVIVILLWTTYFGDKNWENNIGHRMLGDKRKQCEFTSNKNRLPNADYILFQPASFDGFLPWRLARHRWVLFNLEAPVAEKNWWSRWWSRLWWWQWRNDWWMNVPFNYSSTYSSESDFPQPYGVCTRSVNGMHDSSEHISDVIRRKSGLVTWFVTNCNAQSHRLQYVIELKRYIQVDIYGECGSLHCPRSHKQCESKINQKYKFYLAFENSLCEDYVTEKAFRPMISKYPMIPVVMGYANYNQILPPHSFIDVRWFKSPLDLANYLLYLDKNNTEYAKYFKWRSYYHCRNFALNFTSFCERAHELYDNFSPFSQTVTMHSFNYKCVKNEIFQENVYSPKWLLNS